MQLKTCCQWANLVSKQFRARRQPTQSTSRQLVQFIQNMTAIDRSELIQEHVASSAFSKAGQAPYNSLYWYRDSYCLEHRTVRRI